MMINDNTANLNEVTNSQKKILVIFIILLVIMGQLAISLYLPSMPNMVSYFKTNDLNIQLSLTLYLIGYGLSQFFYGPLSDIYGRRLIILLGLSIFSLASLLAVFSTTISIFLFARILQGIGMGCGDTMGRAILCDCFQGKDFVKAACNIGLSATITPMLAPVLGGYIEAWSNWQVTFIFMLLYGIGVTGLIIKYLPETKFSKVSSKLNFNEIIRNYWLILQHRSFLAYFIPGLVCFVGEVAYNMVSPFLIQQQLKWGPVAFGWFAIIPIIGLLFGTLIVYGFNHRFPYPKMVFTGLCIMTLAGFIMLSFSLMNYFTVSAIVSPMLIFMIGVGITYPNTNLGALTPFVATAGIAGALQGGLQMLSGGAVSTFLAHLHIESLFLLSLILVVLSCGGLIAFIKLTNIFYIEKQK